jgi:hypothetical protein
MKKRKKFEEKYMENSRLDFSADKSKLIVSYMIRLIGLFLFYYLFGGIITIIRPEIPFSFDTFLTISIANIPHWLSIIFIILVVMLVLYLHELVHASLFFLSQGVPPKIGINGPIIYAAASGYLNARSIMIINALTPFTVISVFGLILSAILPPSVLPWTFIPSAINAAAAGGDFIAVFWLIKLPAYAIIQDYGDILVAYEKKKS